MGKTQTYEHDFLIIGGGIIGLAIAREIRTRKPSAKVALLEKESSVASHSSGRNSGVLHAGFYYSPDSLKARFSRLGNAALASFCQEHSLPINRCGKVVVAKKDSELSGLQELSRRAEANKVNARLIDAKELAEIEPNAKTVDRALYSPDTSTVDPVVVCRKLLALLEGPNFILHLDTPYERKISANTIRAGGKTFSAGKIINAAGLYADKIAHDFGFGSRYTILPFKGLYLKYTGNAPPVRTNIYPVPNLANPFLGVHFTMTAAGGVKLGPTAIPAFWRENYSGLDRFKAGEFASILGEEAKLFLMNSFHFRDLALAEMKKYRKSNLLKDASDLVRSFSPKGFDTWSIPGIRAQLLDIEERKLIQDFVVESDSDSVHILNAVSPAFTCSFPFAEWIFEHHLSG